MKKSLKRKTESTNNEKLTKIPKPGNEGKKFKVEGKPDKPNKGFEKKGVFKKFEKGKNLPKKQTKPTDWNEFKKNKKVVREKRKQSKNLYDVIAQAKQIGEKLRIKKLDGGTEERKKLVNQLHKLMGNQDNYVKFVLAHDMARIVQYMIKFGTENVRQDIAKELIPETVTMMQSKYGKFVVKRILKYGNAKNRSECVKMLYGHAVKLSSHAVSAPILEYAYSTWASSTDKINLIQEFFGDMYKQTKDLNIKHLKDVYSKSPDMKIAALSATKANLTKILNKDMLDSQLVQSVLCQFLEECNIEDRTELITQLAPHIVVISNSKDGSRVAMQCIWHGTNKDKKVAMKALKEHAIELSKHEFGHCTIIALFDSIDDTILLNKIILEEILKQSNDLVSDNWGRKVLLWLVRPGDTAHFHPQFINELETGRKNSTSKKDVEIRRKELLNFSSKILLQALAENVKHWFEQPARALVSLAVLKAGEGEELQNAFKSIATLITDTTWLLEMNGKTMLGIEDSGIHMILKKLTINDKNILEKDSKTFSETVIEILNDEIIETWIKLNRGCFLLVSMFGIDNENITTKLNEKLKPFKKVIKKQDSAGAKFLLQKLC